MTIWVLVAAALFAWSVVAVALGLWLGRLLRERRRGGTIDLTITGNTTAFGRPSTTIVPEGSVAFMSKPGGEGQSAA